MTMLRTPPVTVPVIVGTVRGCFTIPPNFPYSARSLGRAHTSLRFPLISVFRFGVALLVSSFSAVPGAI